MDVKKNKNLEEFWKTFYTNVEKIIFIPLYGCRGIDLCRHFVIFEREKITFCREPITSYCSSVNYSNLIIQISYNPKNHQNNPLKFIKKDTTKYNFKGICSKAGSLLLHRVYYAELLDAYAPSLEIYFKDKKKKVIKDITDEDAKPFYELYKFYMPEEFRPFADLDDDE